jgi:hypothetical protein
MGLERIKVINMTLRLRQNNTHIAGPSNSDGLFFFTVLCFFAGMELERQKINKLVIIILRKLKRNSYLGTLGLSESDPTITIAHFFCLNSSIKFSDLPVELNKNKLRRILMCASQYI